jgi:deoxycytidine triphosphate deaminase
MTVYNPSGYRVAKGARLLQIVFIYLARPVEDGYVGRFQGENL